MLAEVVATEAQHDNRRAAGHARGGDERMLVSGASVHMKFSRLLRLLFAASVVLAVLPFGAVHQGWLLMSCAFSSALFVVSNFKSDKNPAVRPMLWLSSGLVLLLGTWVIAQSVRWPENPFAHPEWQALQDLLGPVDGAISINPANTLGALPQLVVPFLVFATVPLLFDSDRRQMGLFQFLALFGGAVAILGIVQFTFFPDSLVWAEKRFYMNSLTATFVNRNTAGTFLAMTTIINFALAVRRFQHLSHVGGLRRLMQGHLSRSAVELLIVIFVFLMSLSGVFLTQSRGAALALPIGLVVTGLLLAVPRLARKKWSPASVAVAAALGLGVLGLFAVLAARVSRRLDLAGVDPGRLCTFEATGRAIADNPVLGTGLGTFPDVFPAYRAIDCAGFSGVWYQAHNSFLEGYLTLGPVFAIAVAVGLIGLVWMLAIGVMRRRRYRFAPAAALGVLTVIVLHALVDFSIQIHGVAVYAAAILGSGTAFALNRHRASKRKIEIAP